MGKRKTSMAALVGGVLAALGCQSARESGGGSDPGLGGPALVARLDEGRTFAEPVKAKNLTVWPILGEDSQDLGDFLTLEEAQGRGLAVVAEMGAASDAQPSLPLAQLGEEERLTQTPEQTGGSARVNSLEIENKGDLPILVCGGTVVKGGQQDRQIAQDFVIAPGTRVPVDAFCVEAGRWTNVREGKPTAGLMAAGSGIAPGNVRYSAVYAISQDAVWENVRMANAISGKSPATGTLIAALEETEPQALAFRDDLKKAVRAHFQACRDRGNRPVGFAYAVEGKPVTVRTFAHPKLLDGQFESFLNAMCMEADLARRAAVAEGKESAPPPASLDDILTMVREINEAKEEVTSTSAANRNGVRRASAGGNLNCYLEAPASTAAEDSSQAKKVLLPVSQDWTRNSGDK